MGIAGVAGALLVLNRPFGFVALLGVIALMGMIQRNSVSLIDQIEQDRAKGIPALDAIGESTVSRARPIVLTASAAVLAMHALGMGHQLIAPLSSMTSMTSISLMTSSAHVVTLPPVGAPSAPRLSPMG